MNRIIQTYLDYFFHSFTKFDLFAIGWAILIALLLIVLAIFLKNKGIRFFILFLGLLLFFAAPPTIKIFLDLTIRKSTLKVDSVNTLKYARSLVVTGSLANEGKIPFSSCLLETRIFQPKLEGIAKTLTWIKPDRFETTLLSGPIAPGETKPFSLSVESFESREYNLSLVSRCYP